MVSISVNTATWTLECAAETCMKIILSILRTLSKQIKLLQTYVPIINRMSGTYSEL